MTRQPPGLDEDDVRQVRLKSFNGRGIYILVDFDQESPTHRAGQRLSTSGCIAAVIWIL